MSVLRSFVSPFGTINRGRFFLTGCVLVALKFALDYALSVYVLHVAWRPIEYVWSKSPLAALTNSSAAPQYMLFLIAAMPFAWVGVCLCCQRLRSAGAPIWLSILFFVPIAKWFLFASLIALPEGRSGVRPPPLPTRSWGEWIGATRLRSALATIAVTAAFGIIITLVSVEVLQRYGSTLFLATPFALGLIAAILHNAAYPRSIADSVLVTLIALTLIGAVLLAVAVEGVFCILMAAPLAIFEAVLGCLVGHAIAATRHRPGATVILPAFAVLPLLLLTEPDAQPAQNLHAVSTSVTISAPPATVWRNVVGFNAIPEPRELIFRSGIAYPKYAVIEGAGVGAVRHCVFSTGEFVEPITEWHAPVRLGFDVTAQPQPLRELSIYGALDTPHLHGYFQSRRGQFDLVAGAGNTTQLVGTTWYWNKVQPDAYWNVWSRYLVHAIHRRVLNHIKAESEAQGASFAATAIGGTRCP